MRNATIHEITNGWLVAFTHEKEVWEYAFTDFDALVVALSDWFKKHKLP